MKICLLLCALMVVGFGPPTPTAPKRTLTTRSRVVIRTELPRVYSLTFIYPTNIGPLWNYNWKMQSSTDLKIWTDYSTDHTVVAWPTNKPMFFRMKGTR